MATQIGVDQVIPWQADRSIAKWKAGRTDKKWRQVLESATEQSRRSWTPQLDDCVTSQAGGRHLQARMRAWRHGDRAASRCHEDLGTTGNRYRQTVRYVSEGRTSAHHIYVLVGPEGGISDAEVEAFTKAGAEVCVLGSNILRASTAGPVALSLLARALGRFV